MQFTLLKTSDPYVPVDTDLSGKLASNNAPWDPKLLIIAQLSSLNLPHLQETQYRPLPFLFLNGLPHWKVRVLENTLTLPGFILEHWLCSSSFSTSWAITWLPAKASDNQSIKKMSSVFAVFSCHFYTSSLLVRCKNMKSSISVSKIQTESYANHSLKREDNTTTEVKYMFLIHYRYGLLCLPVCF